MCREGFWEEVERYKLTKDDGDFLEGLREWVRNMSFG